MIEPALNIFPPEVCLPVMDTPGRVANAISKSPNTKNAPTSFIQIPDIFSWYAREVAFRVESSRFLNSGWTFERGWIYDVVG